MPVLSPGAQRDLVRFAGVGLQFAAVVALFTLAGLWADRKLGSEPWLVLLGAFLGFGLGLWSLISKFSNLPNDRRGPPRSAAKGRALEPPADDSSTRPR